MPEKKKFNYNRVMIRLCCLMVMISLGFTSSTKSIFITPVCNALGIFASVNTAGYALGAPLANLCYDIFGN